MSRDPLEELFGPLEGDDDGTDSSADESVDAPKSDPFGPQANRSGLPPEQENPQSDAPTQVIPSAAGQAPEGASKAEGVEDWMSTPVVLPPPPGNAGQPLASQPASPAQPAQPAQPVAGSNADLPTQPFNPFPEPEPEPAQATVEELFPDAVVLPAPVRSVKKPASSQAAPTAGLAAGSAADSAASQDIFGVPAAPFAASRSAATNPGGSGRSELPTRPVPAAGKRFSAFLPWIIIGIVAIGLLIGALIFVNSMKAPEEAPPAPTPEAPAVEEPPTTPSEEPTTPPTTEPADEPEQTEAPKVEVSGTVDLDIGPAGISVQVPYELDPMQWYAPGGDSNRVTWESNLMNSFPDSCAAMRSPSMQSPWGIEENEAGKWVVVRPEGTCAADPELYNQVWGLMQVLADSAKPLN